jgi:hypothetical protein
VSDELIGDEPAVDEAAFAATQRLIRVTALRGTPLDDDSCSNCRYFLEPGEPLAFCWHEKFQILVSAQWWCHHWEMPEA